MSASSIADDRHRSGRGRHAQRVSVACSHCRLAKARCDRRRPCVRCVDSCRGDTCNDSAQLKRGPKRHKRDVDAHATPARQLRHCLPTAIATAAATITATATATATVAVVVPAVIRSEDDMCDDVVSPCPRIGNDFVFSDYQSAIPSPSSSPPTSPALPSPPLPPPLSFTPELDRFDGTDDAHLIRDDIGCGQAHTIAPPRYPRLFCIVNGTVTAIVDRWSRRIRHALFANEKVDSALTNALTFYSKYLADAFARLEQFDQMESSKARGLRLPAPADPYHNSVGWSPEKDLISTASPLPIALRRIYQANTHVPTIIIQSSNPHVPFINAAFARLLAYNLQHIHRNHVNFYSLRHEDDVSSFIAAYMQAVASNTAQYRRIGRWISSTNNVLTLQETVNVAYSGCAQPSFLLVQFAVAPFDYA